MDHGRNRLALLLSLTGLAATAATASAQPVAPADEPPVDAAAPVETAGPEVVIPVAEPTPEPEVEVAGYDKGFFLKSRDGRYALKMGGRAQVLFAGRSLDDGEDRVETGALSVTRLRLTLEGHAHSKRLGYKLQTDFGRGFVTLKDAILDLELTKGVFLRGGQWKRPFSRQQITSSGRLELVDRAIADSAFGNGRDIGVVVHNGYEKSPEVEWVACVFNGTGDRAVFTPTFDGDDTVNGGSFSNVPRTFRPMMIARVGWNHGGIKGYSEADLEGGDGVRFGVGAAVIAEADWDRNSSAEHKGQVDYVVKASGFSSTGGIAVATAGTGLVDDHELSRLGAYLQAGYMLTAETQVAARFALVDALGDGNDDVATQNEALLGASFFPYGHDAKIQVEAGTRFDDADVDVGNDLRLQLQAQLVF